MEMIYPTAVERLDDAITLYEVEHKYALEEYLKDSELADEPKTHDVYFYSSGSGVVYKAMYAIVSGEVTCTKVTQMGKEAYKKWYIEEYGVEPEYVVTSPHSVVAIGLQPFTLTYLGRALVNDESVGVPDSLLSNPEAEAILRAGGTVYMRTEKNTQPIDKASLLKVEDYLTATFYSKDPVQEEAKISAKHAVEYLGEFSLYVPDKQAGLYSPPTELLNQVEGRGYVLGISKNLSLIYVSTDRVYYNLCKNRLEVLENPRDFKAFYGNPIDVLSGALPITAHTVEVVKKVADMVDGELRADFGEF